MKRIMRDFFMLDLANFFHPLRVPAAGELCREPGAHILGSSSGVTRSCTFST